VWDRTCRDFKFRSKKLNMLMKTKWDGYIIWSHLCCFACIFYFYIFYFFIFTNAWGYQLALVYGVLYFLGFSLTRVVCQAIVKELSPIVSQCVMNQSCGHNWLLGNTLQFSFPHVMNFVTNLHIKLSLTVWLN
jgi:hypothetical protein